MEWNKKKKTPLHFGTGLIDAFRGDKLTRNIHICWAVCICIFWFVRAIFVNACARFSDCILLEVLQTEP